MTDDLIKSLQSFKTIMKYRGLYFDGDKSLFYSHVRKDMATIYDPEDLTLFGPVENTILNIDEESEEEIGRTKAKITVESTLITKGRNRVIEKIKEMRQSDCWYKCC